MGSKLNRALLPRDVSGRIDLEVIGRRLKAIAGGTQPRSVSGASPRALLDRLDALVSPAGAPSAPHVNGHVAAPPRLDPPEPPRARATHGPAAPSAPVATKPASPTDVRGIGRVAVAPVTLSDLAEKPTTGPAAAPSGPPASGPAVAPRTPMPLAPPRSPSPLAPRTPPAPLAALAAPIVETAAPPSEPAGEVDLGSLPPLEVRAATISSAPPPARLTPTPAPPPSLSPAPAASVRPAPLAGSGTLPPARPSFGSIPALASVRPPTAAPEEVAAVSAAFDELLVSAPVEPAPRVNPPVAIPRATPSLPSGPRRPPSMQVPAFRPSISAVAPAPPRPPPPLVSDEEAIEPVEMEEMEVEEIVAPVMSKAPPPPLMSRPPALPPIPPKKR